MADNSSNDGSAEGAGDFATGFDIEDLVRFRQLHYIIMMFLSALGIVLNVIGIVVISLRRRSHCSESRFVLLLSLGCSDIFVCASVATSLSLLSHLDTANSETAASAGLDGPGQNVTHDSGAQSWPASTVAIAAGSDGRQCLQPLLTALLTTAQIVSLLNLLGMAVDHYVAIVKPLHYDAIMKKSHAALAVCTFWLLSFILGAADLYSGAGRADVGPHDGDGNIGGGYCTFVNTDPTMHPDYVLFCVVLFCLISMSILYTCVYIEIAAASRRLPLPRGDYGQSRRALLTTWLILGTFLLCWLPGYLLSLFLTIAAALHDPSSPTVFDENSEIVYFKVQQMLLAVCLLNSLCDAIIYMTHMSKLRQLCRRYMGRDVTFQRRLQSSREPLTRNTSV